MVNKTPNEAAVDLSALLGEKMKRGRTVCASYLCRRHAYSRTGTQVTCDYVDILISTSAHARDVYPQCYTLPSGGYPLFIEP